MSDVDLTKTGWQRGRDAKYHYYLYYLQGSAISLCGNEYRRDVSIGEVATDLQCLVCFCRLQALGPQPELFKENE